MFRRLRSLHKLAGLCCAAAFLLLAASGFVLANKDRWTWVKPETAKGSASASNSTMTIGELMVAATTAGIPELKSMDDIARLEIHADKGVAKVLSKEGFREVQLDVHSGRVLADGVRWDQFAEGVHDLRAIHPALRDWVLPVVAIGLVVLATSGLAITATPIARRRRFERGRRAVDRSSGPGQSDSIRKR